MSEISKLERLISNLFQSTLNDSIVWRIEAPPKVLIENTDSFFPLFLITTYKDKEIGLYEQRYKYYMDEDVWCWATEIGLCIFTNNYVSYRYEKSSPALKSLFLKASEKASGIDDLLN